MALPKSKFPQTACTQTGDPSPHAGSVGILPKVVHGASQNCCVCGDNGRAATISTSRLLPPQPARRLYVHSAADVEDVHIAVPVTWRSHAGCGRAILGTACRESSHWDSETDSSRLQVNLLEPKEVCLCDIGRVSSALMVNRRIVFAVCGM